MLDSEDYFSPGCQNVSQCHEQQFFSGLVSLTHSGNQTTHTAMLAPQFIYNLLLFQGVGGTVHLPKGYLKGAYELIRERGGVCISDEVQCILCLTCKLPLGVIVNLSLSVCF